MVADGVYWFNSNMAGLGKLSPEWGSFIQLLDKVLIDGYNLLSPETVTYDSASGHIIVSTTDPHGFLQHQKVLLEGADQAEFNGEFAIVERTATQLRIAPQNAPTVTTATGGLTIKGAPVGTWEKAFVDTSGNIAAYRNTQDDTGDILWRFDDSGDAANSQYSSSAGVEFGAAYSMTSITDYQGWITNPRWGIRKNWVATNDPVSWCVLADKGIVYVHIYHGDSRYGSARDGYVFGWMKSYRPADAYHGVIAACDLQGQDIYSTGNLARMENSSFKSIARAYHQQPGLVGLYMHGLCFSGSSYFGYSMLNEFPNPVDNGYYLHAPILVTEDDDNGPLRGEMPGIMQPLHSLRGVPGEGTMYETPDGALYYVVDGAYDRSTGYQFAYKLHEAWR